MPLDQYGNEYHPICLLCGCIKEPTESILCYNCKVRYNTVQQESLQNQLFLLLQQQQQHQHDDKA
jgi:hypothetical protein